MEGVSALEKKIKRYVMQIVCALSAIALWLFVTYTEDPEVRLWIRNVPVSYVGADVLASKNLVFTEKDEPTEINVKVAGRRSVLQRLLETDVRVVVDYSAISETGSHTLPFTVSLNRGDLQVTKLSQNTLRYEVDTLVTVEKTVTVTSSGAESLHISQFTASPATVKLTGPQSVLQHVNANVHVDLTSGKGADAYPITLSDQSGKKISMDNIAMEQDYVALSATRELPVSIEAMNLPQDRELDKVVYEPERIAVRGKLSDLLTVDAAPGISPVWVDFAASPATVGPIDLVIPENLQVIDTASATATYYFKE